MIPKPPAAPQAAPATSQDHYSYRMYADPNMASQFDTKRFSGPIGTLLAEDQARVLAAFLGSLDGRAVLDVGTGTGRAAIALAGRGALVTGVDASEEMLKVARERAVAARVAVLFQPGDAHHLPFADAAFDVAVSLRVLMHTPDWQTCLRELCRVSRDRIVFDYPAACSAAAVQAAARRVVAGIGGRTEAYRVFRARTVAGVLAGAGFRVHDTHRQFVLPIAFHKAIGSRAFTRGVEGALERVGLLKAFGSPVTVVAVRCTS